MSNSDRSRDQYVDISYGWKGREEITRLRSRRRRQRWGMLVGTTVAALLLYLFWRLG